MSRFHLSFLHETPLTQESERLPSPYKLLNHLFVFVITGEFSAIFGINIKYKTQNTKRYKNVKA